MDWAFIFTFFVRLLWRPFSKGVDTGKADIVIARKGYGGRTIPNEAHDSFALQTSLDFLHLLNFNYYPFLLFYFNKYYKVNRSFPK